MDVRTQVHSCVSQFNMVGQRLPSLVIDHAEKISAGLAQRLAKYAEKRMQESGFGPLLQGAEVEVYTLDGNDRKSDRCYTVKFSTRAGGYVEVSGIHVAHGWPTLDFGFEIGVD